MPKFRKKPVVIDAIHFDGANDSQVNEFAGGLVWLESMPPIGLIETLEGSMQLRSGDWLIRGVNGELYPCKNDIFQKTYEPA